MFLSKKYLLLGLLCVSCGKGNNSNQSASVQNYTLAGLVCNSFSTNFSIYSTHVTLQTSDNSLTFNYSNEGCSASDAYTAQWGDTSVTLTNGQETGECGVLLEPMNYITNPAFYMMNTSNKALSDGKAPFKKDKNLYLFSPFSYNGLQCSYIFTPA